MGCDDPCDDCSTGCTPSNTTTNTHKNGLTDIEDLKLEAELAKLQARTKEIQELMAKARIEASATDEEDTNPEEPKLRSADWFNREGDMGMTSLYIERYLNLGFTLEELMSGKPIVGIAQSGSDLTPVSFFSSSPWLSINPPPLFFSPLTTC